MSSSSSNSHKQTPFSCPLLLTDGGDICFLSRLRSSSLGEGKRTHGDTGEGRVLLKVGGIFFFLGVLLALVDGRSTPFDVFDLSSHSLVIGGVPGGSAGYDLIVLTVLVGIGVLCGREVIFPE